MALRTHLQDVRKLLDPLTLWNWDLFLPRTPVGGDVKSLVVKMQTSEIPEIMIVSNTTELKGVKVKHKSKREWKQTLDSTIIETRDLGTRSILAYWAEMMHSPQNNSGSYKSEYAIDGAEMLLYDEKPQIVRRFSFAGWYPEHVGSVNLSAEATGVVFPVTWSYDYFEEFPV